jgi:delta 1-pyrroline-5-carboxylate dehydrogenase
MQGAVATLHMVHCIHMAGFPNGLVNAITGKGSEIGDYTTTHPGINCIRLRTDKTTELFRFLLSQVTMELAQYVMVVLLP